MEKTKNVNNIEMAKPERIEIILEDGNRIASDDFVVITNNSACEAQLFYNADAVTLGQAIQMISFAYTDQLSKMPTEQAQEVRDALRAFIDMEGNN